MPVRIDIENAAQRVDLPPVLRDKRSYAACKHVKHRIFDLRMDFAVMNASSERDQVAGDGSGRSDIRNFDIKYARAVILKPHVVFCHSGDMIMDPVGDSVLRQLFDKGLKSAVRRGDTLASYYKHMPDTVVFLYDLLVGIFQNPDIVPVDHCPFIGTCHFRLQTCFCTL